MPQYQFVMRSGPTPGVTFSLEGDQIIIGRDATNGLAINDAEVSRKHSRLVFQGGKYVLEDLGSTNGTFVNGQRLAGPAVLKSGDIISLGEHIVMMYDVIKMDPGATMVAAAHKFAPGVLAGSALEQAPEPTYSTPPAAPAGRNASLLIFIGIGLLFFICLCVGFFWWVDATYRWCAFFSFIPGC